MAALPTLRGLTKGATSQVLDLWISGNESSAADLYKICDSDKLYVSYSDYYPEIKEYIRIHFDVN